MHKPLSWIGQLRWVNEDGGSPLVPGVFGLVPELTQYGLVGYERGVIGSISREPFPDSTSLLLIIVDDEDLSMVTMRFSGDASALLSGTRLSIDGQIYEPYDEPNYDAGEDVTDMAYNIPGVAVFTAGATYQVEFIRV